eukprot:scaffold28897_cov45-Isochrysis_galbana.AAC.1
MSRRTATLSSPGRGRAARALPLRFAGWSSRSSGAASCRASRPPPPFCGRAPRRCRASCASPPGWWSTPF